MTLHAQQVSEALAATVDTVGTGIVRVEARLAATGIVWSSDGLIITAHHVVEHDDAIRVGLADGQTVPASLVGRDPTTDIAVLRVAIGAVAAPVWREPEMLDLHVGHLVLALGRPGQTVQATLGIISALGASWSTPAGGHVDRYLQTDVVMYPGFSGGPLVDMSSRVIGLNTSALVRGMSVTLPSPTVRRVVDMLLQYGRVRRGYLGVSTQPVRLPTSLAQQVGQETGLLLITVETGSPAEQAGLLLGDVLVALADTPVRHAVDLLVTLQPERIATVVPVRFIRGGQLQEQQVSIGERA